MLGCESIVRHTVISDLVKLLRASELLLDNVG